MRVGVVGCGVVGAAVARELQLRGAETVVFEAVHPGAGTSGTTFAWVNSYDKEPRPYHELNAAGVEAHHALLALDGGPAPGAQWFFPTGNLTWGDATLEDAARLEQVGYAVQRLSAAEARALEPDLRLADGADALFLPEEGYVLPSLLLARLLGEALDRGAELRRPAAVRAVEPTARGLRVTLANGEAEEVDRVVSCTGRWTTPFLAAMGHDVPTLDPDAAGSETVGYLACTEPLALRLGRVVHAPRLHLRPDGGGRVVLQALDLDDTADPGAVPAPDGALAHALLDRLAEVAPGCAGARLEWLRVGQRVIPADRVTVAGSVDGDGQIYAIATHSAVTLAPLLGRLAAEEILEGTDSPLLRDFRPGRFGATEPDGA